MLPEQDGAQVPGVLLNFGAALVILNFFTLPAQAS
jgi:hypothetical protein